MAFKEKIESSPWFYFLGALALGFGTGLAAYKFVLEVAKLDTVRKESYVLRETYDELKSRGTDASALECGSARAQLTDANRVIADVKAANSRLASDAAALRERLKDKVPAPSGGQDQECPPIVLDANYVVTNPPVGPVPVCVSKATEIASRRSYRHKSIGGYEVQMYLQDGAALFYCSIACYENTTSLICNGPSRSASRGWADALWQELSRK